MLVTCLTELEGRDPEGQWSGCKMEVCSFWLAFRGPSKLFEPPGLGAIKVP